MRRQALQNRVTYYVYRSASIISILIRVDNKTVCFMVCKKEIQKSTVDKREKNRKAVGQVFLKCWTIL